MPYRMALGGEPAQCPCKYVYICRNPKDVSVSYYHFERQQTWSGNYSGPGDHWLKIFTEGKVQRGDWFDHVLGWWGHAQAGNIFFLKYEDLLFDFSGEVKRLMEFLGYPYNVDTLESIKSKTSFSTMKEDGFSDMHEIDGFQGFLRNGRIGTWKSQFTHAQNQIFDKIIQQRLQDTGLNFNYE